MKKLLVILLPLCFAACNLIDDDLSVCGEDMLINYQMQLRTELRTQLQTELSAQTDTFVRAALEEWLAPVFTDHAKDIDLHFYSATEDVHRRRIQDVINANQTTYTINLPQENYIHLALANIADNRQMYLTGIGHSTSMELGMPAKTEFQSMNTGVFSARLPMKVEDKSAQFNVYLYMVNAAVALVIDTTACDSLLSLSGTLNDAACGFWVRDSLFDYSRTCMFQMENVPIAVPASASLPLSYRARRAGAVPAEACLATVGMPTRDGQPWTLTVKATLTSNRTTTSTLTINDALQAGTLRVFRLKMAGNGSLEDNDGNSEVGVTVTLDWKDGGNHDLEI